MDTNKRLHRQASSNSLKSASTTDEDQPCKTLSVCSNGSSEPSKSRDAVRPRTTSPAFLETSSKSSSAEPEDRLNDKTVLEKNILDKSIKSVKSAQMAPKETINCIQLSPPITPSPPSSSCIPSNKLSKRIEDGT